MSAISAFSEERVIEERLKFRTQYAFPVYHHLRGDFWISRRQKIGTDVHHPTRGIGASRNGVTIVTSAGDEKIV
jgi:hypothetical protein